MFIALKQVIQNQRPASYNTFNMIKRFQKVKSQNYSLLTKKLTG